MTDLYSRLPKMETTFFDEDLDTCDDIGEFYHLDLETTGLCPVENEPVVLLVGYDPDENSIFRKCKVVSLGGRSSYCPNIVELLNSARTCLIQNALFDTSMLCGHWTSKAVPQKVHCTKILSKMVGNDGNSYGHLVKTYLGYELPKGNLSVSDWTLPIDKWSEAMRNYCAYDVAFGLRIYQDMMLDLSEDDKERYLSFEYAWKHIAETAVLLKNTQDFKLIPY